MYDISKTRMLLTTVVFAAVAALFAAGANARIPADTGSAFAAQESLGIGRYAALPSVTKVAQPSETNARIPADTSSAFAAQESLRLGRYLAAALRREREDPLRRPVGCHPEPGRQHALWLRGGRRAHRP